MKLKTLLFKTKPSFTTELSCFFNEDGIIKRPFASVLHSYVPIKFIIFWVGKIFGKDTKLLHILPHYTTLLKTFTTTSGSLD